MSTIAHPSLRDLLLTSSRAAGSVPAERERQEEAGWIRAAARGDRDAFRRLVERHGDRAFEVALRIVGSREEAEEAAQDAFVRAWRALEGFREEARFSTWLYRIVTRCALDAAARSRRRGEHEVAVDPERMEAAAAPPPPASDRALVARLMTSLSPVQRAVVTHFYFRDASVDDVAVILDLPTGTVKTHLFRSRARLREAWAAIHGEGESS